MIPLKLSTSEGAVIFVGSGLSADVDTGLPNGIRIAEGVLKGILIDLRDRSPDLQITDDRLNTILMHARDTPFEQLFNGYPFDDDARDIFSDVFRCGKPNVFHLELADAVARKKVVAVVTTNYDTCLEQSLQTANVIFEEGHLTEAADRADNTILFKLHGCASKPLSIVYRLKDEGALPKWKRTLLSSIVQGRDVVLLGYSGRDFDICPVLLRCEYKNLVWVFPGSDLEAQLQGESPSARYVFGNRRSFPRVHASLGGFDAFFEAPRRFRLTQNAGDIIARLFEKERQHPREFAYWRASLLNAISCRIGTEAILCKLDSNARAEPRFIRLRSDALERSGRYRDSIAEVGRWRSALDRNMQPDTWLETFILEAGRYYTAGYFREAARTLASFQMAITSLRTADIPFNESLAVAQETYLYLLMRKRFPAIFPPLAKLLYRALAHTINVPRLQRAADLFYERGLWQELHLLHQAARDFGIALDIGTDDDRHLLLSALDGFSQLNNLVGRAAAYRKSSARDPVTCASILDGLWAYGHNPEYWKSFLAFRKSLPPNTAELARSRCANAFAQCQYSLLLGLVNRWRLRRAGVSIRKRSADEV